LEAELREMTEARDDWRWGREGGFAFAFVGGVEVEGGVVEGVEEVRAWEEDMERDELPGSRVAPLVARDSWPGGTCHVALYIGTHQKSNQINMNPHRG
jgi:hypothetical protein